MPRELEDNDSDDDADEEALRVVQGEETPEHAWDEVEGEGEVEG